MTVKQPIEVGGSNLLIEKRFGYDILDHKNYNEIQ